MSQEERVSAVVACAQVAMEVASLAQNATTTIYPWKDSQEHIDEVVEHARRFLRKHASGARL